MAKREIHVKTCDRDGYGKERPAVASRSFSFDGGKTWYDIDLCEQHLAMFDRELSAWRLLAREVEAPPSSPKRSHYFTEESRRETQRIRELMDKARTQAAVEDFAQRRAAEIERDDLLEQLERDELNARQVIPGALKWRLTDHARERMAERGFTIFDVLRTASHPQLTHRQPWRGPNIIVQERLIGDGSKCRVVVNETTHAIITVIDRNDELEREPSANLSNPNTERKAQ